MTLELVMLLIAFLRGGSAPTQPPCIINGVVAGPCFASTPRGNAPIRGGRR